MLANANLEGVPSGERFNHFSELATHLKMVGFLRKSLEDTSKKSKIAGVILMKNGIFFKKNIHLNLIKQRVKWTSVVTD